MSRSYCCFHKLNIGIPNDTLSYCCFCKINIGIPNDTVSLFDVDHLEIMAPLKWPEPMMDYFVDECFKMVQDGRTPANENSFFRALDRSMVRKSFGTTFCQMDLTDQFRRVRSLWDKYHEILKNLEIIKACTSPEHVTVFVFLRL